MPTLHYAVPREELIERGFLQPVKRGRPTLYASEEARKEAKKAQQKECVKRHAARVKEANRLLKEALVQEALGA